MGETRINCTGASLGRVTVITESTPEVQSLSRWWGYLGREEMRDGACGRLGAGGAAAYDALPICR